MLALLLLDVGGLDCVVESVVIFSVTSSNSCTPLGGVDIGVSDSVALLSYDVRLSPLLRGFVLACGVLKSETRLENVGAIVFGSQGIGLLGSLEAQLGILWCLCCVMVNVVCGGGGEGCEGGIV